MASAFITGASVFWGRHLEALGANLVELIYRATRQGKRISKIPGEAGFDGTEYYFAADSEFPRYDELGRMLQQAMHAKRFVPVRIPVPVLWTAGIISETVARIKGKPSIVNRDKAWEGISGDWVCSSEQAYEDLQIAPAASLQDRLNQTAQWYQSQGWL